MKQEDYLQLKNELMRRKTYPYHFSNQEMADGFFKEFIQEVSTARCYNLDDGGSYVTHDQRAEKKLCKLIEGLENDCKRMLISLADVRISVEDSIRSKGTKL